MKGLVVTILSASLVLPLALDATGQTRTEQTTPKTERQAWVKPDGVVEVKKLIGVRVKDTAGKDLGEIDQLLVNDKDGKITHAVIGVGGLAGIGESKVVVPWSDVKVRWEGDKAMATMDRTALDKAPKFERAAARDRDRTPAASPGTERR